MARQQSVNNVFNVEAAEEPENVEAAEEPEAEVMSKNRGMSLINKIKKIRKFFKPKKNIQEEPEAESDVEVEEETCAICLDTLGNTNLFITECGHKFHANCMISSLRV